MKEFTVTTGPAGNRQTSVVRLDSVLPGEPLTPKLARRAAYVAQGCDWPATVWDWENDENGIGYRLYKESARKLYCVDGNVYTKS